MKHIITKPTSMIFVDIPRYLLIFLEYIFSPITERGIIDGNNIKIILSCGYGHINIGNSVDSNIG